MRRHWIAVAVTLMFAPFLAGADAPTNRWQQTLEQTSTLLRDANFAEARVRLSTLTRDMVDVITHPGADDRLFAIALAQLAVAEAGAGNADDAIWYWQIAQNVHADIRTLDVSPYGKPGEVLSSNVLPTTPETCTRPANAPAPAIIQRTEPKYPKGAQRVSLTGLVIVELELDENGRPIRPQVLRSPSAALTYSTLITLREWRFAPQREGASLTPFCRLFSFGQAAR